MLNMGQEKYYLMERQELIRIGDFKKLSVLIKRYSSNKKIINKKIKEGTKRFNRFDYELNCQKYLDIVNKNL